MFMPDKSPPLPRWRHLHRDDPEHKNILRSEPAEIKITGK